MAKPSRTLTVTNPTLESSSAAREEFEDEPPAYSSVPGPSNIRQRQTQDPRSLVASGSLRIPSMPILDYGQYIPSGASISKDKITVTMPMESLNSGLLDFLRSQASLPPKPVVRITGTTSSYQTDFDISLNTMAYFLPDPGAPVLHYVRGLTEIEAAGFSGDVIQTQLQRFLSSPARSKSLIVNRQVINWDTSYICAMVFALASELNYGGKIVVSFPNMFSKMVLRSSAAAASQSTSSVASYMFSSISEAFTKPVEFNINAVWPYSSLPPPLDHEDNSARSFNICSERSWWATWGPVIEQAMISRQRTLLGPDSWMEWAMLIGPQTTKKTHEPWGYKQ